MANIRIGKIPASKRTWPIKGRGLGVIRQGAYWDLMRRMVNGYRPTVKVVDELVMVETDFGFSFGRSKREFTSDLQDSGIDPTTVL